MTLEPVDTVEQDAAAVTAVRNGDAERYRELVERHQRRVYAVAWSRLGDAAMAEEATQEAFIRAYRRLWLLGDGAKFAGWVNTIARRVAINFGLRHRRELNKRERWALENPPDAPAENEPLYTPETLRQTLASLPPVHRECLVLFYIEGKSGAEAAEALGISEAALRVRLHRARAALRERLEEKLEGSLQRLGPSKALLPAVMAGALASSSAKAATAGGMGAVSGALAKWGLGKWLLPFASFFSFLFFLPMVALAWFSARMELRNFRDPEGFRARLYRQSLNRRLWVMTGLMVGTLMVVRLLMLALAHFPGIKVTLAGLPLFYLFLGIFSLTGALLMIRRLAINRNPFFLAQFAGLLVLGSVCFLAGISLAPEFAVVVAILIQAGVNVCAFAHRPLRMDYNLFLRAAEGLIKKSPAPAPKPVIPGEMLRFARFLGSRWLVSSHRWMDDGLQLRLPPTGLAIWLSWMEWIFNWSWRRSSVLQLSWDGTVTARLGQGDRKALAGHYGEALDATVLEKRVADAVSAAWRHQQNADSAAAELALGQQSDADVFVNPPQRVGLGKFRRAVLIVAVLLLAMVWAIKHTEFGARLEGLKPPRASESEVRAFMNSFAPTATPPKVFAPNDPDLALFTCFVLPSTNLFTPTGLKAMRDSVANGSFASWKNNGQPATMVISAPLPRIAVAEGWISWNDLGIRPSDVAKILRGPFAQIYTPEKWDIYLTRMKAWSWVRQENYDVERMQLGGVIQLRLLQMANCLDLVNRPKLIEQIASTQDLSATPPPGQPVLHHWRNMRGLFFTPCFPALQDTYCALAALQILGGLDKIDREACIQGILAHHQGKGYFTSPDSGGFNEYHIDGSARDTIAAFESLRILGALDRVKDLRKWTFRVRHDSNLAPGQLSWEEVEAWVAQQRLARILREGKGSLLDAN